MSNLKEKIKEMSETEKKNKSADEILKIIEAILDYKKMLKIFFRLHQELIKENQNKNLIDQFLNGCKCQNKDLIL